jgi:hypothetical protein
MPDTSVVRVCNGGLAKQEFDLARSHTGFELSYNLGINPVTLWDI